MTENQTGITAFITAYARAYHVTHDAPLIFNDFLVDQYFTEAEHIQLNHQLAGLLKLVAPDLEARHPDEATALAWVMQCHNGPITLSRSRYCEDCLEETLSAGLRQYVILGAGFDTFAFRRRDLDERLAVFEVDHPFTQAFKRNRVTAAGWETPDNLHFVPLDFKQGNLAEALKAAGYRTDQMSFFNWLGVTYYLNRSDVEAILQSIVEIAPSCSRIVFDYLDTDAFDPQRASHSIRMVQEITKQVGEPMKCGFEPGELEAELCRLGLRLEENYSPDEIETRYFKGRTDLYHADRHFHFARAAVM